LKFGEIVAVCFAKSDPRGLCYFASDCMPAWSAGLRTTQLIWNLPITRYAVRAGAV